METNGRAASGTAHLRNAQSVLTQIDFGRDRFPTATDQLRAYGIVLAWELVVGLAACRAPRRVIEPPINRLLRALYLDLKKRRTKPRDEPTQDEFEA